MFGLYSDDITPRGITASEDVYWTLNLGSSFLHSTWKWRLFLSLPCKEHLPLLFSRPWFALTVPLPPPFTLVSSHLSRVYGRRCAFPGALPQSGFNPKTWLINDAAGREKRALPRTGHRPSAGALRNHLVGLLDSLRWAETHKSPQ